MKKTNFILIEDDNIEGIVNISHIDAITKKTFLRNIGLNEFDRTLTITECNLYIDGQKFVIGSDTYDAIKKLMKPTDLTKTNTSMQTNN